MNYGLAYPCPISVLVFSSSLSSSLYPFLPFSLLSVQISEAASELTLDEEEGEEVEIGVEDDNGEVEPDQKGTYQQGLLLMYSNTHEILYPS